MIIDLIWIVLTCFIVYDTWRKLVVESKKLTVIKLGPGSVLIRNAFDRKMQTWLAKYAMYVDETDPDGGFWFRDKQGKKLHLNATRSRGRIYKALLSKQLLTEQLLTKVDKTSDILTKQLLTKVNKTSLQSQTILREGITPETAHLQIGIWQDLVYKLVKHAQKVAELPSMNPTHLLLLYYTNSQGLKWHRDTDPNDGDNLEPIVSISIGNSCTFGYKKYGKEKEYLNIHSGDVLIWGGCERNLLHSIEKVELNSAPKYIQKIIGDARLNFTFRSAPNILGFEKHFSSQQYFIDEP